MALVLSLAGALVGCASSTQNRTTTSETSEFPEFERHFTGATLRFDYFHTGIATEEHISLDQIRAEGPWPGSHTHLVDDTNLGKFLFAVHDAASKELLYSRGFASIYGEWETIREAKEGIWRTFHESQRFPEPRKPVRLTLSKRRDDGNFAEIFHVDVDPDDRTINRSPIATGPTVRTIFSNGASATKVDLVILGDGYTNDDRAKFFRDAERLAGALFSTPPFSRRQRDFNVFAIHAPSSESGVTNPRGGVWKETPLGLAFNAFDSDRYMLTQRNRQLREIAALAPYDTLMLIANTDKYGGGGIFNLWSTCCSDSSQAEYIFVHEFGHSFAGLADEYYTSSVSYEDFTKPGIEPWEPNITALLDPAQLKWKDLVEKGTPLPTPWDQKRYDRASYDYQDTRRKLIESGAPKDKLEALYDEVKRTTLPMLQGERFAHKVGAFEGAGYQAKGLYRSEVDCIMFTRNPKHFCRVCSRGIEMVLRLYTE